VALREYARAQLVTTAAVGTHPLDADQYSDGAATGGAPIRNAIGTHPLSAARYSGGAAKKPRPKKPWTDYATWAELKKDPGALAAYMACRADAIENPDFDWTAVLATVQPKLAENREYIGVISVGADGRSLYIVQIEASPSVASSASSKAAASTTFASIPAELVAIHAARPGLFLFHTHPSDLRCCPLPSSHDLAAAIYFGALAQYAANVIISRFGVFSYGVDWSGYKGIVGGADPQLATLNLSHDVVAAHEAIRSWSSWQLADYLDFYPRHRLFINSYPSSVMVADTRRFTYLSSLESPIDHDLITDHSTDILEHRRGKRAGPARSVSHARHAAPPRSLRPATPLIFD
jgi:hypothetical protein